MRKERPLNKAEQKLFARLYTASLLDSDLMHIIPVSEAEEDGIVAELDSLRDKLMANHGAFYSTGGIIDYIKGLRK